jgi:2-polyprenyl-3-methyl-5-hydroxy-6-metoxy-1,4-benzoquinol methylase
MNKPRNVHQTRTVAPKQSKVVDDDLLLGNMDLTGKIEPFDSFWEAPENIEKGYKTFGQFYKYNYLKYVPADKNARILVISCGPGYFLNLLAEEGYRDVLGLDSDATKIQYGRSKNLTCRAERAFPFLQYCEDSYDVIFCEQELNHLTKREMLVFLRLCFKRLAPGGTLIVHGLNGANPITGAEALAQNFDHYNTFTEYTLRQVLDSTGFGDIRVIPLNLYVFYKNPVNYVLMILAKLYTAFFRFSFLLYGKSNKIFTKKIAAIGRKLPT